ncbi:flagellar biosynthesis, initiation of hook assembly [Candidatus Nitrotoga sp. HW29]|uniref:flagellar hook assembly protein FlgD n=1 Tax=Candidatus Nitrotoga sp. HW29 TaxID=2886963 RepID=UPI001EF1F81A|nr:flagellar hook assembly protein FlgD [Candidatus Nitrotoga sp. HW29]CAH1904217.1 flagellar biosynthesis, initiation of hook assembly [Candidatus Nitrotoga sp. HW29]
MINATQDTGSAAALISSLNAKKNAASGTESSVATTEDRFLKLLVTQMKNQDPLNPMDNAQVTSQMAQLSTVSGIDKLNATLQALSDTMSMGQSLSATSMIGHGVLIAGSAITLKDGKAIGGIELTQPADSVKVLIQDAAGNTVSTMQMGPQKAGVTPLIWDGQTDAGIAAINGTYKFSVEAMSADTKIDANALTFGMVNAVTPGTNGAKLDVGSAGSVPISAVKQII